jgi:outer membrane protein OmpA-like peptidoglycan-associated protein
MKRSIAALASCLMSLASLAADVTYFADGEVPSPGEVASLLAPSASATDAVSTRHGGSTRGIRMLDTLSTPHRVITSHQDVGDSPYRALPARPLEGAPPAPSLPPVKTPSAGAVALGLRFGLDDAQLLPTLSAQLDALAAGIKRLLACAVITIAGHTDAFGSPAYNLDLSLKRAMAVRSYLVRVHGIPGRQLVAVGKGKSEPLNRTDPFAPENRRVQVSAEYDVA